MQYKTLTELRSALDEKKCSATELAQESLRQAKRWQHLNSFITIDADVTLAEAARADERLQKGERGRLLGLPIAHKDVFVTQAWLSTAASKILANYRSPFDATVVAKMAEAGAVCVGKTNMDEFAMGSANENSYFGAVLNPWNNHVTPGGSSGGSAAAVAARIVMAATGSDTGGSIRQPAAMCGVTGIKPTYGRISRFGMIAFASSLDQAGPFAISAADCALLLNSMIGLDPNDASTVQNDAEDFQANLGKPWSVARSHSSSENHSSENKRLPLAGLKIGCPIEYFDQGVDNDVLASIQSALDVYQDLGAEIISISLPKNKFSIPVYYVLASAEASSNLSRYDGVRYGYRAKDELNLIDMYSKTRAEGFGDEVKRRLLLGTYVLSHGYYDAYYCQARKIRRLIAEDFQHALGRCDVIVGPVAPTTAWPSGQKSNDPVAIYLADIFTLSTSLAGLPAISIPCGFDQKQLPIGLQIIGNYFKEANLLQVADAFQRVTQWHLRQPNCPQNSCQENNNLKSSSNHLAGGKNDN